MNNCRGCPPKIEDQESSFNPQSAICNPQSKEPEPDDPMELVMVALPGGAPEFMATCIIEEYARLGMGEQDIFRLFSQPIYQTHAFYRQFGEAWVRDLIRKVLSRTGRMHITVEYKSEIPNPKSETNPKQIPKTKIQNSKPFRISSFDIRISPEGEIGFRASDFPPKGGRASDFPEREGGCHA